MDIFLLTSFGILAFMGIFFWYMDRPIGSRKTEKER